MTRDPTVVVVGAGVIGLSTARALVERGVGDVTVLDRDAMGSGGTGRSSGVVRCHYGIRSLAAMAWRSLPVLANAMEVLGADSGFRNTGYLVGVGTANTPALEANLRHAATARHRGRVGRPRRRQTPVADGSTRRFCRFCFRAPGWVRRRSPDRVGLRLRRAARGSASSPTPSGRLADARRIGSPGSSCRAANGSVPTRSSWPPGRGRWTWSQASGSICPCGRNGRRFWWPTRRALTSPASVFSDLVSLQYVRPEGRTSLLLGDSDHSDPGLGRSRPLFRAGRRWSAGPSHRQVRPSAFRDSRAPASARCTPVATTSPPITTRSSRPRRWRGCSCWQASAAMATRSLRQSESWPPTSSSRVPVSSPPSIIVTSGSNASSRVGLLTSPHPYAGAGQMR